jgi:hypothetical protein
VGCARGPVFKVARQRHSTLARQYFGLREQRFALRAASCSSRAAFCAYLGLGLGLLVYCITVLNQDCETRNTTTCIAHFVSLRRGQSLHPVRWHVACSDHCLGLCLGDGSVETDSGCWEDSTRNRSSSILCNSLKAWTQRNPTSTCWNSPVSAQAEMCQVAKTSKGVGFLQYRQ